MNRQDAPILSKSRIKRGLQCPKSLHLTLYRNDLKPEVNAATQFRFDEGNVIGEAARAQFPGGVLITNEPRDRIGAATATQEAIDAGANVIFEASFFGDNAFARVDVLQRHSNNSHWDVIEVKSSKKLKDEHIEDVAIQAVILSDAGVNVGTYNVMHLNADCVFPDLDDLFIIENVTPEVNLLTGHLRDRIAELHTVVGTDSTEPVVGIVPQCAAPYPCPFRAHCWKGFPDDSVFDLPGVGEVKGWSLVRQSKSLIADLNPLHFKGKTQRAIKVSQSGQRVVDTAGITKAISQWEWPLYFFDFETLMPAIPRYNGAAPYTEVPFQFSCHVWESPLHNVQHFEHLHLDSSDPREGIAQAIVEGFGAVGSVLSYNASVERGVLTKLAGAVPKHAKALLAIVARLVDPLVVLKDFVYDARFRGDFGLKSVAPVLLGDKYNYDRLDVGDGMESRIIAERIIASGIVDESQRQDLLTYCRQDTMAMVDLFKWMVMV
jgi:hypothetical protein